MSPLHPDVIRDLNVSSLRILPPVDTRCLYLGLTIILGSIESAPEMGLYAGFRGQFRLRQYEQLAREIRWPSWAKDRIVRRRELARVERLQRLQLEPLHWYSYMPPEWGYERLDLMRRLKGID